MSTAATAAAAATAAIAAAEAAEASKSGGRGEGGGGVGGGSADAGVTFIGRIVEVHGTSRTDMNGQRGKAVAMDEGSGRYTVQLLNGDTFKFKPTNLRIVGMGAEVARRRAKSAGDGRSSIDGGAAHEEGSIGGDEGEGGEEREENVFGMTASERLGELIR